MNRIRNALVRYKGNWKLLFYIVLMKIIKGKFIRWFIPPKWHIKLEYQIRTGYNLNIDNPITFNEKIQWIKLYDKNPIYHRLVDKYEVRSYVEDKLGADFLIPILGVYNSVDEIPFDKLPEEYVLKCTHDSGTVIIRNSACMLTDEEIKQKLRKSLSEDYYYVHREWCYKGIKPRITCEQYMTDESGFELKDYKIFCFLGNPKIIQVDFGRFKQHKRNLYDLSWNYIDASIKYPTDPKIKIIKPKELQQMLECAKKLSSGFPHVRVDLYYINGKVYFGEMTFYHGNGCEEFRPDSLGNQMGHWIELPQL